MAGDVLSGFLKFFEGFLGVFDLVAASSTRNPWACACINCVLGCDPRKMTDKFMDITVVTG